MQVQSQWVIGPMGGYLCLRYEGVEAALRMSGVKARDVFAGIQVMEGAALEILNERRDE